MNYAGFWKRFAASLIDGIIASYIIYSIVAMAVLLSLKIIGGTYNHEVIEIVVLILAYFFILLYFPVMECSSTQGTLGKMALRIKVTDLKGNKIGFGRAIGRSFSKIISITIIFIGFIMVAFTEKKQGLHDKMAGCLVVTKVKNVVTS